MDELTIEAARRGDRAAQAALIRALQDVWYRFALGLLRDHDLAADAAQETALRFLRDLPKFNRGSTIKTWSLGIALNVTREQRRRKTWAGESAAIESADDSPSPMAEADQAEQVSKVRLLFADLPDRQREALLLRFFEDLSVDETAKAMNAAPGTIKATVHQALRSLRNKLE